MNFAYVFLGTCAELALVAHGSEQLAGAPMVSEVWHVPDNFDGGTDQCYTLTINPDLWPSAYGSQYQYVCQESTYEGQPFTSVCEADVVYRPNIPAEFQAIADWFDCMDLDFDCPALYVSCQDGGPCWTKEYDANAPQQ
jgi:hypothetical protein